MRPLRAFLVSFGTLIMSDGTLGQQGMFLERYREQIQSYIMTGHAGGWKNCDIMSADSFSTEGTPQIAMDLDKINTMNIKHAFASSHCVLVNYKVGDAADLPALLAFGWAAINHVRIALVLKFGSGITLDMVANTTKLPFLVAADLKQGKEQFLCPVVGEIEPRLENSMCKPSYVSYENKTLRIAQMGIPPDFIITSSKVLDGLNIRLMKIIEHKLNAKAKIYVPRDPRSHDQMVSIWQYTKWHIMTKLI